MPFEKVEAADDEYPTIEEYVSDNITVAIRLYTFGQQRIQISVKGMWRYPDIIGPEC